MGMQMTHRDLERVGLFGHSGKGRDCTCHSPAMAIPMRRTAKRIERRTWKQEAERELTR